MSTSLGDELAAQAADARDPGTAMAAIDAAIAARQRKRRLTYTAGAGVAAAAIILTPTLLLDTPQRSTEPAQQQAAAQQPAVAAGNLVDVVTPKEAPFALPQVPRGWGYAGTDGASAEYSSGGTPAERGDGTGRTQRREQLATMIVVWLSGTESAPGTMDRTVNGRQLLLRNTDTTPPGGRTVIVDVGRGMRATVQFPASTADLPEQQLLDIASKVQIRDYTKDAVG